MRVLLATDGSEDARGATAWLTRFPLPAGSHLRVVSVVNVPPSAWANPHWQASLRHAGKSSPATGQLTAPSARLARSPLKAVTSTSQHRV